MNSLQKIGSLARQIKYEKNVNLRDWNLRSFHTKCSSLNQFKLDEKPAFLKKLKVKQARMQKDDGLPVFLKKGTSDKILYNLTLAGTIYMTMVSLSIIYEFSKLK